MTQLCACGCGKQVAKSGNRYLAHHNTRNFQKKIIQKRTKTRMRNRWASLPHWLFLTLKDYPLCQCGCGKRVSHPRNKFILGHHAKGKKQPKSRETIKKWKETRKLRGKYHHTEKTRQSISKTLRKNRWASIPKWFFTLPKDYPLCGCGCGNRVRLLHRKFIHGHNARVQKHTEETKQKISLSNMGHLVSEETRRKLSLSHTGKKDTEETRKKKSLAQLGRKHTKETKEKCRVNSLAHWNSLTPEQQRTHLENSFFKAVRHPNKTENKISDILKPLGFMYNGKNHPIIKNRRPDFLHFDGLHIIEYDGGGGHNTNIPWIPKNKSELDDLRDQEYRNAGKKILRLLPEDLRLGKEYIIQKVKQWMDLGEYQVDLSKMIDVGAWFK